MTQRYTIQALAEYYRGKRIAIIGNGPSVVTQNSKGERSGIIDFSKYSQPLWVVNGAWHYHPTAALGFQMDDVKGVAMSQHPQPGWYAGLVKNAKIPIITTKTYQDYPATVAYPLADVIRYFGIAYFTDSLAYMTALAIMFGISEIDYFGADYSTAPPHERAGTEHWCGVARMLGVQINVSEPSSLLKPMLGENYYMPGFYGYSRDTFPLDFNEGANNHIEIKITGDLRSNEDRRKFWNALSNPFFDKAENEQTRQVDQVRVPAATGPVAQAAGTNAGADIQPQA